MFLLKAFFVARIFPDLKIIEPGFLLKAIFQGCSGWKAKPDSFDLR
jgi:hypothetical protein